MKNALYLLLFLVLGLFTFGTSVDAASLRFVNNTDYYNAQCGTTAATYGNYYGYGPGITVRAKFMSTMQVKVSDALIY